MHPDLLELLRRDSKSLNNDFEQASIQGRGTPQEVADYREGYFRSFIAKYYPFPYQIAKGGIIDSFGRKSASVDCVICNPIHPHTIDKSGRHTVLFADAVDATIEIKPDIGVKSELHIALKQMRSVKQLQRTKSPYVDFGDVIPEKHAFGKTVPACLFTMHTKSRLEDTIVEILDYYITNSIPLEEHFDMIVINNVGIIYNQRYPGQYRSAPGPIAGQPEYDFFVEYWKELTVGGFLLYLNMIANAQLKLDDGIMFRYLRNMQGLQGERVTYDKFWQGKPYYKG
jgi:hypothetical protein